MKPDEERLRSDGAHLPGDREKFLVQSHRGRDEFHKGHSQDHSRSHGVSSAGAAGPSPSAGNRVGKLSPTTIEHSTQVSTATAASHLSSRRGSTNESEAAAGRFRATPKLLDQLQIADGERKAPVPHVARMAASIALQTQVVAPICLVLPSAQHVAHFVAIVAALQCLAADYPECLRRYAERYLKPGSRVRILPDKNVFIVGHPASTHGYNGIYFYYTEKESLESNGKHFVLEKYLSRYEPTTRKLPKSRASIKLSSPSRTEVDALAGVDTFGNTGLYENRVVLVGPRSEFARVLNGTALASDNLIDESLVSGTLAESFSWGSFDENGQPFVLSPEGSGGCPLVAIARDFPELELASLRPDVKAGSQIILTERFDQVVNNLDLANRIGERQRLVVFVDASRRAEAATLRKHGWQVWEPRPWELVPRVTLGEKPARTRVIGIDETLRSAAAERHPSVGYMPSNSHALAEAYKLVSDIESHLSHESASDDEKLQETMDAVRRVFFGAAGWLSLPSGDKMDDFKNSLGQLRGDCSYLSRCLGNDAASALRAFGETIEAFVTSCLATKVTPKGAALFRLAKNAVNYPALKQVLVTGSRQSREEADAFLGANGIQLKCHLRSEIGDAGHVVTFSILRRDMFEKLVDPWPAKSIMMVGYDFEIEIYKQRLRWRETIKRRLELNSNVRTALTAMSAASFGTSEQSSRIVLNDADEMLSDPIDRIGAASRVATKRQINIPEAATNEPSEEVRLVRFVGRSWMPMAQDYHPVCLIPGGGERKSTIEYADPEDLRPGTRILVREGGGKDVIKAIAQHICGDEQYDLLWHKASLWREALRSGGDDPVRVARQLQESGIRRHIYTLRSWVTDPNRIGPRSDADVMAIAQTFKLPGKSEADWRACCNAISELRGLHLSAGARLTDHLFARCGRVLLEPAERETAIEFELGVVWILEVADVEATTRQCPATIANRLQWLGGDWREQVYSERIKVKVA